MANQLPWREHNALPHVFSSNAKLLTDGMRHYRIRSAETSSLLLQLLQRCQKEGIMSDALKEFAREAIDEAPLMFTTSQLQ